MHWLLRLDYGIKKSEPAKSHMYTPSLSFKKTNSTKAGAAGEPSQLGEGI